MYSINPSQNQNENISLQQGKQFRQTSKRYTPSSYKKPNQLFSPKEGFTNNNDLSISSPPNPKTKELIQKTDDTVLQKMQQLKDLQIQYNDVLQQYNQSLENMNNATLSYIKNDTKKDSNELKASNVFVNTLVSNPSSVQASYVGSYNNDSINNGMYKLIDETTDYTTCKNTALQQGYSLFGLQNTQRDSPNSAQCMGSNDITTATSGTPYQSGCSRGTDGHLYGNENINALYSVESGYIGCYGDTSPSSLVATGPIMSNYSSVYVISNPPWGTKQMPSNSGGKWIWYTNNANNGAPVNTQTPMTFLYNYNNTNGTIMNITLWCICDDSADIYWNSEFKGTVVAGWDGAGSPTQLNFQLMPGNNYIQALAINTGGPAGLLLVAVQSDNNNTVVFTTDETWKYTPIVPKDMIINAQNFDVDSCKVYASQNKYAYYALQNGLNGSSQCYVTNDLQQAQAGGSKSQSFQLADGNIYGGDQVMALYDTGIASNANSLNKIGYVQEDGRVSEYPSSMIDWTNPSQPVLNNDASCGKQLIPIDTITWSQLENTGKNMTSSTLCSLSSAVSTQQQTSNALHDQLVSLAKQMSDTIVYVESLDYSMFQQMGMDKVLLTNQLKKYKENISQSYTIQDKQLPIMNTILQDVDTTVQMENYNYMFWSALAVGMVLVTTIHVLRKY